VMKAIIQDRYGPPDDILQLREIDKPVVEDDEVLVRARNEPSQLILSITGYHREDL